MRHIARWIAGTAILQYALLVLLAWLVPGLTIYRTNPALVVAAIVSALLVAGWWFTYRLSVRIHPLLVPILTLSLFSLLIMLAIPIVSVLAPNAISIADGWTAIMIAYLLMVGGTLLGGACSLHDPDAYEWFVIQPLKRRYRRALPSEIPGVLFLEIDGLAEPILRAAMARGDMPTLKRWRDSGSHTLVRWEPDLSSQTVASQAGILLGENTGIPAFRWYDKVRGQLIVSSRMGTVRELEHVLSNAHGLLAGGGAARWNAFSGGADDNLGVYSTLSARLGKGHAAYFAFFSNPYTLARTFWLMLADIIRERYQARQQRIHDVRPRIRRTFRQALVRAGCTVLLQEAGCFMLIADIFRGLQAVYMTFFAYDEVAHHAGIDCPEAFAVLRTLDAMIATLEHAASRGPRRYHFVVLSDHGQSQGAPFRQRFRMTLEALVRALIARCEGYNTCAAASPPSEEPWIASGAALDNAMWHDSRTARLLNRARRHPRSTDRDTAGQQQFATNGAAHASDDVVVLGSGNLGLISFPGWPKRMTYEEIVDEFPGLLSGLATHPGIGAVLVHSASEGGVVLGANGIYFLDHGYAAGENPLTVFGPHAAAHLKRSDGFTTAPDIMILSRYDPTTNEVAAFEELVGSHGGLGGPQTEPFVLFPATLPFDMEPVVGAVALHRRLRRWVRQAEGATGADE